MTRRYSTTHEAKTAGTTAQDTMRFDLLIGELTAGIHYVGAPLGDCRAPSADTVSAPPRGSRKVTATQPRQARSREQPGGLMDPRAEKGGVAAAAPLQDALEEGARSCSRQARQRALDAPLHLLPLFSSTSVSFLPSGTYRSAATAHQSSLCSVTETCTSAAAAKYR